MRRCLGCGTLIRTGSRCAPCQRAYRPAAARHQLPALAKGLQPACAVCGSTDRLRAHHVIPVAAGGAHDLMNLTVLCHRCHVEAHRGR